MTLTSFLIGYIDKIAGYFGLTLSLSLILIVIAILFIYRTVRTLMGEKFSGVKIFLIPLVYSVFVLFTFLPSDIYQKTSSLITAIVGIVIGLSLSRKVEVYEKKSNLYYKKSLTVTFLWTLFFSVKIVTYLYYPQYYFQSTFSALLTLVTGMLIGEAIKIYREGHRYKSNVRVSSG